MSRRKVAAAAMLLVALCQIIVLLVDGQTVAAERVKVIDGDSLRLGNKEVRLHGIDAPEYKQWCHDARDEAYPCGKMAFEALKRMSEGGVKCKKVTIDRYKREVSVCFDGVGENINEKMVASGWAVAYGRYTQAFTEVEKEAKRQKIGIWQGRFMIPELYRAYIQEQKLEQKAHKK